jgi:sulfur-carrier protein adenylyltransferase/sulfurtransferase
MIGKFYVYNALSLTAKFLEIGRNPDCLLCGENPKITGIFEEDTQDRECKDLGPII